MQERLEMQSSLVFLLAFGIGVVTGLAFVDRPGAGLLGRASGLDQLEGSRLVFMESPLATYGFSALALGELVADKLPFIPSRTSPGPLFGRVVLGALSGATLCAAAGHSVAVGCDTRRSGRSDRRVCGISGSRPPGEELTFAGLGDCLGWKIWSQ